MNMPLSGSARDKHESSYNW